MRFALSYEYEVRLATAYHRIAHPPRIVVRIGHRCAACCPSRELVRVRVRVRDRASRSRAGRQAEGIIIRVRGSARTVRHARFQAVAVVSEAHIGRGI